MNGVNSTIWPQHPTFAAGTVREDILIPVPLPVTRPAAFRAKSHPGAFLGEIWDAALRLEVALNLAREFPRMFHARDRISVPLAQELTQIIPELGALEGFLNHLAANFPPDHRIRESDSRFQRNDFHHLKAALSFVITRDSKTLEMKGLLAAVQPSVVQCSWIGAFFDGRTSSTPRPTRIRRRLESNPARSLTLLSDLRTQAAMARGRVEQSPNLVLSSVMPGGVGAVSIDVTSATCTPGPGSDEPPAATAPPSEPQCVSSPRYAVHSADYSTVTWGEINYEFKEMERKIIKLLWQDAEQGGRGLSVKYIRQKAGFAAGSLVSNIFAGNNAWGTILESSKNKKGIISLRVPIAPRAR